MNATHSDQLVNEYLARLRTALEGIPPERREEIVDEISSHISEERSHLTAESEADVLNLLDRVGDPQEVAAAARTEDGEVPAASPARRIGPVEILALVLTPFIWPVGVILLWLSPAWNVRDKVIGTLLPPGGYAFVLILPVLLLSPAGVCSTISGVQTCSGIAASGGQETALAVGSAIVVVLMFVLPVLTAIYLAWRLRKWSAA